MARHAAARRIALALGAPFADKVPMTDTRMTPFRLKPQSAARWVLLGIILINVAVECALSGADLGLWGDGRWRGLAYQYGGFWAGLLYDWQPNYAAQPVTMFASYAVLHAGPAHLIGNMAGLIWLGDLAAHRVGARGLVLLYVGSALGGAVAFGAITESAAPMIGASGAIFGLAGAWTVWDWQNHRARPDRIWAWRTPAIVLGLAGMNAAIWVTQGGNLAWQTHLGGFIAGAVLAMWKRGSRGGRA